MTTGPYPAAGPRRFSGSEAKKLTTENISMRPESRNGFKERILSKSKSAFKAGLCALSLALFSAGCGAPLKVVYSPVAPPAKAPAAGVSAEVVPFTDARDETSRGSRTIGKITATVADMTSEKLTLAENVDTLVTGAFTEELSKAGYGTKERDGDFAFSGEVKKFRLDVGSRDEIEIAVAAKVTEKETGKTLWEGTVEEKDSRYAGVMGNSRGSLERYITATLSKVVKRTLDEAAPFVANSKSALTPASVKEPVDEKPAEEVRPGAGRLLVTTVPARSKIYIDGVYWGLSPLSSDIAPGVYELVAKQKGFKDYREKVSVRPGQLTELEMTLEGE